MKLPKNYQKLILSVAFVVVACGGIFLWHGSRVKPGNSAVFAGSESVERGIGYFYSDSFGGLSTPALEANALPWSLTAAALVVKARQDDPGLPLSRKTLDEILAGYGFLQPQAIGNWPGKMPRPASTLPMGMTHGEVNIVPGLPITVANLGCASCHAGVTYTNTGLPQPTEVWLGLPNTSLNLEAYTDGIYQAYQATINDPKTLMLAVRALYPGLSLRERLSLQYLVLPRVHKRLSELKSFGRALPFPSGSPGVTNGVPALKGMLHVAMAGGGRDETGFTSIPDLGLRTWRTSLLYDGAYAPMGTGRQVPMTADKLTAEHISHLADITTFFSVPSMGVNPELTLQNRAKAQDMFAFLSQYRAPAFPGSIDRKAAVRGQVTYSGICASCHGTYDGGLTRPALRIFPNWIGNVGTDKARAKAFSPELAAAVNASAYKDIISAKPTGAYVAPPLSGLWATAPYLHNGSVPTIAALLTPKTRPARFLVGGHRLDFKRLGIALTPQGIYPAGYLPFSKPVEFEVSKPGQSNTGHNYGSQLTPREKQDLIEYLKAL